MRRQKNRKHFDQMWEIPPDWDMRKKAVRFRDGDKCSECGSEMSVSTKVFHLHHIIPKKEVKGNHKIDNLKLLCAECYRDQSSEGHQFIRTDERAKYRYKLFPKRYRPIIEAWLEAYDIHKIR